MLSFGSLRYRNPSTLVVRLWVVGCPPVVLPPQSGWARWLVVRLRVVGCPLVVLPPQSGWARWLVVRACGLVVSVNLLFRWLFAPGGHVLQLIYFLADYFGVSACCLSAPVSSVSWSASSLLFSSCLFSELTCQLVPFRRLLVQRRLIDG